MATKRAKTITKQDLERVYEVIDAGEHPIANRLKMDLSYYAGLRVSEIAKLKVDAFLDANGKIAKNLTIFSDVAKMQRERYIPIHPVLRKSIEAFLEHYPDSDFVAVGRKCPPQSVNALTVWFQTLYLKAGLRGCSSHSGRRSFISTLAQRVGHFNGSLKDVQEIAGHAYLSTTQVYIEPSTNKARLVASLGSEEFAEAEQTMGRSLTRPAASHPPTRRGRPAPSSGEMVGAL